MLDHLEVEATNQTVFRQMNEWSVDVLPDLDRGGTHQFLCECSDARCTRSIALTVAEYEAARGEPTRFVIAVDHENPELDHVVAENTRFATVRTFLGPAMSIARASDPRR